MAFAPPPATAGPASTEDVVREVAALSNKLALRVIVLETALQELLKSTPEPARLRFARAFRERAEDLLHANSERLTPNDDAEIALGVRKSDGRSHARPEQTMTSPANSPARWAYD